MMDYTAPPTIRSNFASHWLAEDGLLRHAGPLTLPWPTPGNPASLVTFNSLEDWRLFVAGLALNPMIPASVAPIYQRAQRLFYMGWSDAGMFKVAELVALAALELALNDRFGVAIREKKMRRGVDHRAAKPLKFEDLMTHLIAEDGLSDEKLPFVRKYGGSVMHVLKPKKPERHGEQPRAQMNMSDIRNSLAHGIGLDGLLWSGLLELVRDLIEFSFRFYLLEADRANQAQR
jgi:hypothetical protein